jgi:hypothetical protein
MEFTGYDYLLYSPMNNRIVIELFNKALLDEGYQFDNAETKDVGTHIEEYSAFFYYKSRKMYDTHLKIDYNTKINGEGCINFYTGAEALNSPFIVADTMDVKQDFFQYAWFMGRYYFYALTLPGDINHCPFSKRIFGILANILKGQQECNQQLINSKPTE